MSEKKTLKLDDLVTERAVGRRSAIRAIGATFVGAAVATAITAPSTAQAQSANDADPGDPPGHGRTGFTDRDVGPNADGPGRGVCPRRGHTDADAGPGADGAGRGRGPCHN